MVNRDEIIKSRFENETAPPEGKFNDLPIKDCMAIYAEQYAKKYLHLFVSNLLVTAKLTGSQKVLINNAHLFLPDHD